MCHMNYYVTTNKLQLNYSVRLLWAAASWAQLVVHSNPNSNYSHFKFPLQCQENKLLLHWWISLHSSRKLERPGQGRGWPGQKVGSYALKLLKCTVISSVPSVFTITEKTPTRAFSWLKAPTSAFTFKTLLRHYAKQALAPRSLNVKLGPRRNYHKGRAAIRHYANQTARPLWLLCRGPNFTLRDRGVNARLA